MAHPMSIFQRRPRGENRGAFVDTVWLLCRFWRGRWVPREDLQPCFDEEIAHAYAREQTKMTEQTHEAKPFRLLRAETPV